MSDREYPALALAENHSLEVEPGGSALVLKQGESAIMRIVLTPCGPELVFDAPNLAIRNSGSLTFEGQDIHLRARGHLNQEVGGNLRQRVGGSQAVEVREDATLSAQAISAEARTGSMALRANDDLALNGLRILHNVPTQAELKAQYAKVKTFGDLMSCPAFDPNSPRRLDWGQPIPNEDELWNS